MASDDDSQPDEDVIVGPPDEELGGTGWRRVGSSGADGTRAV